MNSDDIFVVAGDYNLPGLMDEHLKCVSYNEKSSSFVNMLNLSDLSQKCSIFNYSGVILDLILSNADVVVKEISRMDSLVEIDPHHPALCVELDLLETPQFRYDASSYLQFWKADYNVINTKLLDVDWDVMFLSNDLSYMLNKFYDILFEIIEASVPKKIKNCIKYPCWYSLSLIKICKEKKKFHDKWKVYKNLRDYNTYSFLRRRFKKVKAYCYFKYLNLMERSIENNIKSFWDFTKSKRNNAIGLPKSVHYNNVKGDTLDEISDLFADYFQSVYEPATTQTLDSSDDFFNTNIHDLSFTPVEVFQYLDKLDPKKASGPDLIPSFFFDEMFIKSGISIVSDF